MQSSKLIQVLKCFTASELRVFQQFLDAPFLHKAKDLKNIQALFQLLKPYYPKFDSPKLTKRLVFDSLYPDNDFIVGKVEKHQSRLFGVVKEFIIFQHSRLHGELHQHIALYSFYANRKLDNLSATTITAYQKAIAKKEQPSAAYFYERFLFEQQAKRYEVLSSSTKQPKYLSAALESLDHYYLLAKLDLACQLLSFHRMITPVDFQKSLKTIELLTPLLEEEYFDQPSIKVYFRAYQLLRTKGEEAEEEFATFERELKKYEGDIPLDQRKLLNAIIRNYSIVQYHKGVDSYLPKAFHIYQTHLREGYLYYENKLLPSTLGNIVVFGLRMKNEDWVWQFLQEHKNKITGTSNPEIVYQLNVANYYFHVQNYEKALAFLSYNNEDTYYRLSGKRLEIKIYYETKHVLLMSRIDSFKIYIYRLNSSQISPKQKIGNRNFIDLLKQIQLPKTFQNQKRIDKLVDKISSLDSITDKVWLLEKLEELR